MAFPRPQPDRRSPPADFSDSAHLQKQLSDSADAIAAMADDVGLARQIREFNSDQRKRCLAVAALPLLKSGASATAADLEARGSEQYGAALKVLAKDLVTAEQTIAKWEAQKIVWESNRSLLSMLKTQVGQL